MPKPATDPAEQLARAVDRLGRAVKEAVAAIDDMPDQQQAFAAASELAAHLRDTYEEVTELRARLAERIYRAEQLSLAGLASRIGVSKPRAAQLVNAARAARKKEEP